MRNLALDTLDTPMASVGSDPVWQVARSVHWRNVSVWRLERMKAEAERIARLQGRPDQPSRAVWQRALRPVAFGLTTLAALVFLIFYLALSRWRAAPQDLPAGAQRLIAVHGEWATRTRHLLTAAPTSHPPIGAILLLGRQSHSPGEISTLFATHVPSLADVPVLAPVSLRAAGAALRDLPRLLADGLHELLAAPRMLDLREETALAFRVCLGAIQARWWRQQGRRASGAEVLFGCTGTADTTLMEKAIQQTGGRTVHIVHGQATGPSFAGISDHALFKSSYDAAAYRQLHCYGDCSVQRAAPPEPGPRGRQILLMSNLAHPMNDGFRRHGLRDELNLLACVSRAAGLLHLPETQLVWKPHPVTYTLNKALLDRLRAAAEAYGFTELPPDTPLAEASREARWVLCSPSTVATELLQIGTLAIVLDPQRSVGSSAVSALPLLTTLQPEALAALMAALDRPEVYEARFRAVHAILEPASPLDLTQPLTRDKARSAPDARPDREGNHAG